MSSNSRATVQDSQEAQDTHYHTTDQAQASKTATNNVVPISNQSTTASDVAHNCCGINQSSSQANVNEQNVPRATTSSGSRSWDRNGREWYQSSRNRSRLNDHYQRQDHNNRGNHYRRHENTQYSDRRTPDFYSRNRGPSQRSSNSNERSYNRDSVTYEEQKADIINCLREIRQDSEGPYARINTPRGQVYSWYHDLHGAHSHEQYVHDERAEQGTDKGNHFHGDHTANTDLTQREHLSEMLNKGTLECVVCCERVIRIDPVWWCFKCYHVLHLSCVKKWARTSMKEGKWCCPACRFQFDEIPLYYRCLCGAVRSPEPPDGAGAHTCGQRCKRVRPCIHPCTLLCHPGPCPTCLATITLQCACGAETLPVVCSNLTQPVCSRKCGKNLACGVHKCKKTCHEGACDNCREIITQACYCLAAVPLNFLCTAETSGGKASWACDATCNRVLACGVHSCTNPCHPPPCEPCVLLPEKVITCPCGKTRLDPERRLHCTDPIPLCGTLCAKPLKCGPAGDEHFCKVECHEGACPPCSDKMLVQCRCGTTQCEVPCVDMNDELQCQKKCNKKLSCVRHRCQRVCCAANSHQCLRVCDRLLICQHRCQEFCHTGLCSACQRYNRTGLYCECGVMLVPPPVRCGTRYPACSALCLRARACGHESIHTCHRGECPPCVMLTTKACYGAHEERTTIPCYQEKFSCGMPCGKPLSCGKHTCVETCHEGHCDTDTCTQPCTKKRASCGHDCATPCHYGPCPINVPCKRPVRSFCQCKHRVLERPCSDNAKDLHRMMRTAAMQEGGSRDILGMQRPASVFETLECVDDCRIKARMRQMAFELQNRNPNVSSKLAPCYSEHVRAIAAKDPAFAQRVHDQLTLLVQRATESKSRTLTHSFPSMNRQKRQFIHELCQQFGCQSASFDAEPNRNVVVTAYREKSWLPAKSVIDVLARETGKHRVPPATVVRPTSSATLATNTTTGVGATSRSSGLTTVTSTTNVWTVRSQRAAALATQNNNNPTN